MQRKLFTKNGRGPLSSDTFYSKKSDITMLNDASMAMRSKNLRMHKKQITMKIRVQENASNDVLKKSAELSSKLLEIASSGKPLTPSQQRIVKNALVIFLRKLESSVEGDLQFVSGRERVLPNATGNVDRMHRANNAEQGVLGAAEYMEMTRIVRKGFVNECLKEAGYISKFRKPRA